MADHLIAPVSRLRPRADLVSTPAPGGDCGPLDVVQGSAEFTHTLIRAAEQSPCLIVITDPAGHIEYINPKFTEVTGYSREEVIGQNPRVLKSGRTPPEVYRQLWETISSGGVWRGEFLNKTKSGRHYWASACISAVRDSKGRISHFVGVQEDITERRRTAIRISKQNRLLRRRLSRLSALRQIDLTIASGHELHVTLVNFLDQVTSQLGVDTACVRLLNPHTRMLDYAVGRGLRGIEIAGTPSLRLGQGLAGRSALECRLIHIPDLAAAGSGFDADLAFGGVRFRTCLAVPLMAKGRVKGVLEIYHRAVLKLDQEWLDFLEALTGQAAIAIENATLFSELQRAHAEMALAYDDTIEGWARALDLRDKETEGHSRRVTEMTVRLAQALGVRGAELAHIRRGALLHDIGKLGVPDAILLKDGELTEEEWKVMRRHPEYAHEWLSPIAYLRPALEIPYCHHERWDGTGYPRGLKGKQIPLAARIFAAVDIWDALRSDRPYRNRWPDERLIAHLRSLAGNHLDPRVVEVFLEILAKDPELCSGENGPVSQEKPHGPATMALDEELRGASPGPSLSWGTLGNTLPRN